jgi:hypothetical protein
MLDFHLTREFRISGFDLTLFIDVYNLLDQREQTGVYSDTGTAEYTTYPKLSDVDYNPNRIGTVRDLLNRPEWYIAPREIDVGFSIGF